jgi:hypothetical protein
MPEAPQDDRQAHRDGVVRNIRVGLGISLGILCTILLIAALTSFVAPTTPTEKKDLVQAVGILLAAVGGLIGLFFTAQNVWTNQRTLQANLENTQRTLSLTEQSQIAERFTKAIDQLGATADGGQKKLETRLGGIYALESISRNYPETYYSTVLEILTAYVRENAPWPPRVDPTSEAPLATFPLLKPSSDFQAILDVVMRLVQLERSGHKPEDLPGTVNLSGSDLRGASLAEAYLRHFSFHSSNLREALLVGADFRGSNLYKTNFQGAPMCGADFRGTSAIEDTNFDGCDLMIALLQGADLRKAKGLTEEQLQEAVGDENTKLPEGLSPPASWRLHPNEQLVEQEARMAARAKTQEKPQ